MRGISFFGLLYLAHFIKSDIRSYTTNSADKNPKEFNIGGVLSNDDSIKHFEVTIAVIER